VTNSSNCLRCPSIFIDQVLEIFFLHLGIEPDSICRYDYLEVYDGDELVRCSVGDCGAQMLKLFFSVSSKLFILIKMMTT